MGAMSKQTTYKVAYNRSSCMPSSYSRSAGARALQLHAGLNDMYDACYGFHGRQKIRPIRAVAQSGRTGT